MEMIQKFVHHSLNSLEGNCYERKAARAIVMRGSEILLLYTKRYNDYSFPGGGLESDEDLYTGLCRELTEETGATDVKILRELGYIEEFRPYYKPEYDLIHMLSYYYVCSISQELKATQLEDYEISNGMSAVWIDINQAILHNRQVIMNQESSMGFSIERETFVLELIAAEQLF
ncbi:NUDIX hydrolase [Paenibacillus dauci]|uniref:NUDIX hydrolase n=1 Tax=Paenibacillus dauci TaxID=1567106 RepID=UPI000619064C|nr:NUDIX domain-containing protein [Paenibacillus dauci]